MNGDQLSSTNEFALFPRINQ